VARTVVTPRPGEGIIAVTARVCGTARSWTAQAKANRVVPPAWVVRLGQRLTIDCTLAPVAVPAVARPAPVWAHPLGSGCIVPNGSREYGTWRGDHRHGGIDMGAPAGAHYGDSIYAVHAGIAHHGYQAGGAGVYVWVDHRDGSSSWYFHMSRRAVGDGARVRAGQTIGYVGASGNATAAHLHLEVKVNGVRTDPVPWLRARGVRVGC
jgi:murein DD-endopeptidase MepM/ murein hydrolase activator NlpD